MKKNKSLIAETVLTVEGHSDLEQWIDKLTTSNNVKEEVEQIDEVTRERYDADVMYRFDSASGRLKQRSIMQRDANQAMQEGWRYEQHEALRDAGIIRSKFDPNKFVKKDPSSGKWVQVHPYGESNDQEELDEAGLKGIGRKIIKKVKRALTDPSGYARRRGEERFDQALDQDPTTGVASRWARQSIRFTKLGNKQNPFSPDPKIKKYSPWMKPGEVRTLLLKPKHRNKAIEVELQRGSSSVDADIITFLWKQLPSDKYSKSSMQSEELNAYEYPDLKAAVDQKILPEIDYNDSEIIKGRNIMREHELIVAAKKSDPHAVVGVKTGKGRITTRHASGIDVTSAIRDWSGDHNVDVTHNGESVGSKLSDYDYEHNPDYKGPFTKKDAKAAIRNHFRNENVGRFIKKHFSVGDDVYESVQNEETEGSKATSNTDWHGSEDDLEWYQLYKKNPVRVKVKNTSGIGGQPSGTFTVRSFTKISPSTAEFTIIYRGETLTAEEDLDDPKTYVNKKYDRKYVFEFYSGSMPITPRQAFNLIKTKKSDKKGVAEGSTPIDYDKVLDAIAALYGADIWDNDAMQDLANDLEQAGPTDRELDFIIANGKLPRRLKGIQFSAGDSVRFGKSVEEGNHETDQSKSSTPKLSLDDIWSKIQNVVSQTYPDVDPIDLLAPWLKKHGIRDFKIGEILDRAAAENGYKDLYDYYNSMGKLPSDTVSEGDVFFIEMGSTLIETTVLSVKNDNIILAADDIAMSLLEASKIMEAKYHGRTVPLGKPMQGDVAKFKVYVKDPKTGNVKKVNFGDPNMRIKKSNPKRRKSFRARHHCENPGPRTKARYWSCRKW